MVGAYFCKLLAATSVEIAMQCAALERADAISVQWRRTYVCAYSTI